MPVGATQLIPTYDMKLTLSDFSGSRLPGARVLLSHHGFGLSSLGGVAVGTKEYIADSNGQVVMPLWPNVDQLSQSYYTVTAFDPTTRTQIYSNAPFQVAAEEDDVAHRIALFQLENTFNDASTSTVNTVAQAALDAIAARDATLAAIAAKADVATYDPQGIGADAFDRGNHTGTQPASIISDLAAAVAATPAVAANTSKNSYPAGDAAKLSGIQSGAEINQTDAEIKAQYEANPDTNVLTDALLSKLNGVDAGAQANPTAAQLRSMVFALADTNVLTNVLLNKLNSVQVGAQANPTAEEIRLTYESLDDRNPYTDAERSKLAALVLEGLLPPGGAGAQVLTKLSGTDYDFAWAAPQAGGTTAATTAFDDSATLLGASNVQDALLELNTVKADIAYVSQVIGVISQVDAQDRTSTIPGRVTGQRLHDAIDSRLNVVEQGKLPAPSAALEGKFFFERCSEVPQAHHRVGSVFGRAGDITAVFGDYLTSLIQNDSLLPGVTLNDVLQYIESVLRNEIAGEFSMLSGDGPPNDTLGVDGQFYLDRLNGDVYGPKGNTIPDEWNGAPYGSMAFAAGLNVSTTPTDLGAGVAVNTASDLQVLATLPAGTYTPLPSVLTYVGDYQIYDSTGLIDLTDSFDSRRVGNAIEIRSLTAQTNLNVYTTGAA